MTEHWRCTGPVRGWCGTKHRTPEAAARCCRRDQRDCARLRGYSDRLVRVRPTRDLTDDEQATIAAVLTRG